MNMSIFTYFVILYVSLSSILYCHISNVVNLFPYGFAETLSMKGLTLNCMDRKSEAYELVRLGVKVQIFFLPKNVIDLSI